MYYKTVFILVIDADNPSRFKKNLLEEYKN